MAVNPMEAPIYDVHVHFVPGWWYEQADGAAPPPHPDISALDVIAEGARDGAGSRRVLSASVEILYGVGRADPDALRRVNGAIADAVATHADALLGLATIDAFAGDAAAAEVHHAIEQSGLHGIIVDSAGDGAVLGQAPTLPTLQTAAELGVPAFVHPVWMRDVDAVRLTSGQRAAALGRGYLNALALVHLLHARVPESSPDLRLIFTALGVGGLFFAHERLVEIAEETGAPPHVYFDTTSMHPATIRYALDVLGPERVLLGTDWPFHEDGRAAVLGAFAQLGLPPTDQMRILNGNFDALFTRNRTPVQPIRPGPHVVADAS